MKQSPGFGQHQDPRCLLICGVQQSNHLPSSISALLMLHSLLTFPGTPDVTDHQSVLLFDRSPFLWEKGLGSYNNPPPILKSLSLLVPYGWKHQKLSL